MVLNRSSRGFTLIELVIVIVILGILAAVAIPKYEDMQEQARSATLKGQLGSIRSAVAIQYGRNALNGSATFPVLNGTIFGDGQITTPKLVANVITAIFGDGQVPKEPVMRSNAVKTTPGVDNTGGWVYNQTTGMVIANLSSYSTY